MIQGFYRVLGKKWEEVAPHLNKLLRILFDRTQPVLTDIQSTAPTTDDLEPGEMCLYDDDTNRRIYINLDGTIYYWDLTAA